MHLLPSKVLPVVFLCALVVAGCGARAGTTLPPVRKHHGQPAATQLAVGYVTSTATATTTTAAPTPTGTARAIAAPTSVLPVRPAPVGPPRVVSASLSPVTARTGGTLSASVLTTGPVQRVELYLGSGLPGAAGPSTFPLYAAGAGRWGGTATAPSVAGEYHYTVGMYVSGRRSVIDNDAWNIQITGVASASAPQPLPADIPLAPPFSYGNPVPATFTAMGKTVNGSEVTSTTRTDVPPSLVSAWYESHLPRAGWTVDPSTVPAPGASSFSIFASTAGASGTRVCIVQYGASTVHVLYGTVPS